MQLDDAKKDAIARSLESKKRKFVDITDEGEAQVKDHQSVFTQFAYENGAEVSFTPIPPSKQTDEALGIESEAPAKGKGKKAAAKPAAAPAKEKPAKKATPQKSSNNKSSTKTKTKMAKVAKKTAKKAAKQSSAPRGGLTKNPFKKDQKVTYDGKKFTVVRAYMYNNRPYCIISDGKHITNKQVSANSLK
jgi:hypothetical protein